MHSSRMRTVRSLTASSGRGACVAERGMRGKEGHAWGVWWGVCMHGRGCTWWGLCMVRGGCMPPVNRMTDACKKITCRKLRLRAVKISGLGTNYPTLIHNMHVVCAQFPSVFNTMSMEVVQKKIHSSGDKITE